MLAVESIRSVNGAPKVESEIRYLLSSCPPGTKGFVALPHRWVVERTFGWIGHGRRLSKDYEHLPEVSKAMVTLAMIRLMVHRAAHPNRKWLPAA